MRQVVQSRDAINSEERLVANQISQAQGRFELTCLQNHDVEAAIQLSRFFVLTSLIPLSR
jgi:tetrahydromethanopterin S-methyltransferase subunit H